MAAAKALGATRLAEVTPAALAAGKSKLSVVEAKRAQHIVEEIARVDASVRAMRAGDLVAVGKLLTASHRSSQASFENSTAELDFLVDTLEVASQVYGARLTGGGFGGAVMAMTSEKFSETNARAVADAYAKKFGATVDILHTQTGDGAARL
jgi:galactokinase